jgi:hypothetical protein
MTRLPLFTSPSDSSAACCVRRRVSVVPFENAIVILFLVRSTLVTVPSLTLRPSGPMRSISSAEASIPDCVVHDDGRAGLQLSSELGRRAPSFLRHVNSVPVACLCEQVFTSE